MLRHGKPRFPDERTYLYGHTDYPLSDLGERQARRMAECLSVVRLDKIISSDLVRASRTADIIAEAQPWRVSIERDPELREIFMGEWEGLTNDEIKEGYVDIFRERGLDLANVSAPGGETFVALRERALRTFGRIVEASASESRVLIVGHGAFMWSVVSGLFGMELGDFFRFGLDHCAVHLIEYSRVPAPWGRFRLARYNWSPDLAEYNGDLV
jgi:probable phosphoglycerate mutase